MTDRAEPHIADELLTPRLVLRRPHAEDGPALHAAVLASLPDLRPWMAWAAAPLDAEGYGEHLRHAAQRFTARTELRYLLFDRVSGVLVGSSGFHALDWRVPKAEIGYWIHSGYVRRGLVTEAAEALTTYGLTDLGLRRIEIRCDARNERSARIPRALGYTLDAVLKNDDVAAASPAQLRDTMIFSVTA